MSVDTDQDGARINQASLRLAAWLLLGGQLLYIVITQFHTGGDANDHPSIFAMYAGSGGWKIVHLGQFVAVSILLAGVLALFLGGTARDDLGKWVRYFGAGFTVVALALSGVLQAVDGVGNKQVDTAWLNASQADKAARFAAAEGMRWLEWGVRSYQDFALGAALVLLAVALMRVVSIPRPLAYVIGLSGLAYLVQGWVVGSEGFSGTHTTLILVAWVLSIAWMIWLAVIARRMLGSGEPSPSRIKVSTAPS